MVLHYSPPTEPYIRLPAPHSHIILTPPRLVSPADTQDANADVKVPCEADISAILSALNDERVYTKLETPPYPYLREHAISFLRRGYADTQRILQEYYRSHPLKERKLVDGCPFRDIRDTSLSPPPPTTTSTTTLTTTTTVEGNDIEETIANAPKIGDILIHRYPFYEFPVGSEQRRAAQELNASLPVGHEDIIWGVGFWLLPTHHNKGIMSAVLQTLLSDWAIPFMDLRVLKSSVFVRNEASMGVFRKCGFVFERTIEKGSAFFAESKGGGPGGSKKDIHVLKWERPVISA